MERAVIAAGDDMALPMIEGEETNTTVQSLLEKRPVKLFQRVVTTSLETVKIVSSLPELKIG